MAGPAIDLQGAKLPARDGEVNEYAEREARQSTEFFNRTRRIIFVNGMKNSPEDHVQSALALSMIQMCTVIGVYNQSVSWTADFWQCVADKNQFNGVSFSAQNRVNIDTWSLMVRTGGRVPEGLISALAAQAALSRNPPQVTLFNLLRAPENRHCEIFAHSQGNLVLSNALQAIAAVDGPQAINGRVVHTFGSPAVVWPADLVLRQHGFTFDPVTFLAGILPDFSYSKVGVPADFDIRGLVLGSGVPLGDANPVMHAFIQYLRVDPAFVINRFRVGGWGITFALDEKKLAECLAEMGPNMPRVRGIFEYLNENHHNDADEVAEHYVKLLRNSGNPAALTALKADRTLSSLLIRIMDGGWTTSGEKGQIEYLRTLQR